MLETALETGGRRIGRRVMGRWRESVLLLIGLLPSVCAVGVLAVVWERPLLDPRFYAFYGLIALQAICHAALVVARCRAEEVLLPTTSTLTGLGVVLVTRLAPDLAPRQLAWTGLGVVVLLVAVLGPWGTSTLERYKYTAAAAGTALLLLTLLFGRDPNGSGVRWWLGTSALGFRPAEVLKVLQVIFLAGYLADNRELLTTATVRWGPLRVPPPQYLAPLLVMWGLSLALLIWQRDLGVAMLFFGVFLVILYAATARARYLAVGGLLFTAGGTVCYVLFAHVRLRVENWLSPWIDPAGRSYQTVQALYALGSGGLFGAGWGNGYPLYVPAIHTDFPFVAFAEEEGLAAALALLLLYALLVTRGLQIAVAARTPFAQLLATGCTAVLAVQTLVIVGGNLKLIPLTGVTLPFLSYGGSSQVVNYFLVGALLRISREQRARADGR